MSNSKADKAKPPYASYTSFRKYINKLAETGVPAQIDRSVFGNQSGTYISSMIAAFRWLGLTDANGRPNPVLNELVGADDQQYRVILRKLLEDSYVCIKDGTLDLKSGTSSQIANVFREYDLSGSTLTKAVAFFLGAAKDAGFDIGPHMKAPAPPRTQPNGKKRKRKKDQESDADDESLALLEGDQPPPLGMDRITVPLRNMDDGVIYFPPNLNQEEAKKAVKMAVFILQEFYGIDDQ